MTGFEIALSLFVICGLLFYGRWAHNREQNEMTEEEQFRQQMRDAQKLHGKRVEARQKERPFGRC